MKNKRSIPWEDLLAAVLLGMVWAAQSPDDAAGGLAACGRALKWIKATAPHEDMPRYEVTTITKKAHR